MKCQAGDLAVILYSIRQENIGRIVRVKEYIGHFQQGETFQFRGQPCKCAVTDHHWWLGGDDITILYGHSTQASIPDTWLQPIRPEDLEEQDRAEKTLDKVA
jgi:hypothetical protein